MVRFARTPMWFKNLQLHRLPVPWSVTPEQMEKWLAPHAFQPGSSVEMQTQGWASPRDNDSLVYSINRQMLLVFRAEKKLLPASVVNQVTKARALELEEQQGFKVGRKQMRELKEQVTDELLPRAFSIRRDTRGWIDTAHGWLVIDASSQAVGCCPAMRLPASRSTRTPNCAPPRRATQRCDMWDMTSTSRTCAVTSKPASSACVWR
jgi:recombination associated protein RdgC